MKKKILILFTSVGLGHKYIAQNMEYHLNAAGFQVSSHDVFKLQAGFAVNAGIAVHQFVNKYMPWFWRWLYMSETFSFFTLPLRVPLAAKNSENVKAVIEKFKPDMVIATQTSASAAVAYLKRKKIYNGKLVIAFSDYHLHKYWLYQEADHYLVNIPEQATAMEQLKVSQDIISICGVTLKPRAEKIAKETLLEKFNLPKDSKVVLMGSGSLGTGISLEFISQFANKLNTASPATQIVIITGKNIAMKQALLELGLPNVKVLGFYEPMSDLYQLADLYLTKPGGMTVAESLQYRLPIIITHWLPGQEELNYKYLVDHKVVDPVPEHLTPNFLSDTVVNKLTNPNFEYPETATGITQPNQEGKLLVEAVNKVFHNV